MIVTALVLALAAPNPESLKAPRKAYVACLKDFEQKSVAAKTTKVAYAEAIKTACPGEAQALTNALVAYDVAMGTKRAAAEANAKLDISDYWAESQERLADQVGN